MLNSFAGFVLFSNFIYYYEYDYCFCSDVFLLILVFTFFDSFEIHPFPLPLDCIQSIVIPVPVCCSKSLGIRNSCLRCTFKGGDREHIRRVAGGFLVSQRYSSNDDSIV